VPSIGVSGPAALSSQLQVAASGLLERLDPRLRLERPREEHPRPDLVLADVLAVGRDHRVEPEVLLHLHDRAHRIVDPVVEEVEERLVRRPELLDQRKPEPAVDRHAVGSPPLEGDSGALGSLHVLNSPLRSFVSTA